MPEARRNLTQRSLERLARGMRQPWAVGFEDGALPGEADVGIAILGRMGLALVPGERQYCRCQHAPDLLLDATGHIDTWRKQMESTMTDKARIAQLEKKIADLNSRMPKHSVPTAMIFELEELEDELEALKTQAERGAD